MRHPVTCFVAAIAAALALSACSMKPQTVVIDPNPAMMAFGGGARQAVLVTAADLRPSQKLGYRKDETKDSAPLTTGNDVAAAVAAKLREAVADNDFIVAQNDGYADARLKVEVLKISYNASGKYVAPKVNMAVQLRAVAERGGTTYSPTYSIANEVVEALPLTAERNERIINEAVSQALQQVIEDESLWRFLATGVAPQRK